MPTTNTSEQVPSLFLEIRRQRSTTPCPKLKNSPHKELLKQVIASIQLLCHFSLVQLHDGDIYTYTDCCMNGWMNRYMLQRKPLGQSVGRSVGQSAGQSVSQSVRWWDTQVEKFLLSESNNQTLGLRYYSWELCIDQGCSKCTKLDQMNNQITSMLQ